MNRRDLFKNSLAVSALRFDRRARVMPHLPRPQRNFRKRPD